MSNKIKEYKESKEYSIGNYFTTGKDTYKVVQDTDYRSCDNCDFNFEKLCDDAICSSVDRTDNNNVNFILYDSEE